MTGKCGLCGSEYEIQRRKVRYDERADGTRVYYFFRAKCMQCGAKSEWQRTEEGAAGKIEDREKILKASKKWAVLCPFFVDSRELHLQCEGMCEGSRTTDTRFESHACKLTHMARYCKGNWEKCRIAQIKYGE